MERHERLSRAVRSVDHRQLGTEAQRLAGSECIDTGYRGHRGQRAYYRRHIDLKLRQCHVPSYAQRLLSCQVFIDQVFGEDLIQGLIGQLISRHKLAQEEMLPARECLTPGGKSIEDVECWLPQSAYSITLLRR